MNAWRQAQKNQESWLLWSVFLVWFLVFFPPWFALSRTKLRELSDLVGAGTTEQRVRLHTPELQVMSDIIHWSMLQITPVHVVIPPRQTFAQLSIPQLWRATAIIEGARSITFSRPDGLSITPEGQVVILVPGENTNWQPTLKACQAGGCSCPAILQTTPIYWRVE